MVEQRFSHQTNFYKGKVRDVYTINGEYLVMIASDRISAFDVILPRHIPFKGQVLNQLAAYMLQMTSTICPNWLLDCPAPTVSMGKKCEPFKIEMVVRGNITGHAWREYVSGKQELCGVVLPAYLNEYDFFPEPVITPSTKAEQGHDEDISKNEIISRGILSTPEWEKISSYALLLFEKGQQIASQRGLILADTKYEFGKIGEEIILMDEIHTPDSSRYFYADGFKERQQKKEKQIQLSKEFVREWLIENDFMGKPGQSIPIMTNDWIDKISERYIELFEKITGKRFLPETLTDVQITERVEDSLSKLMNSYQ